MKKVAVFVFLLAGCSVPDPYARCYQYSGEHVHVCIAQVNAEQERWRRALEPVNSYNRALMDRAYNPRPTTTCTVNGNIVNCF